MNAPRGGVLNPGYAINRMINLEKIKNTLVLMPDKHMGNLVVSLSAIKALKDFFSERNFYLVVDSAYREIVETIDGIDNLVLYPREQLSRNSLVKRSGIFLKFLRQLKNISPDIAIDLEGRHVSSIMTFLSGASLRVGRTTAERSYFYNVKVNISKGIHKVYNYLNLAASIGADIENVEYRPIISETKRVTLRNNLLNEGITPDKPIICIHPGAGKIYKQWTIEGFSDISDWLSFEGFQVVFVGSRTELEKIKEIRCRLKNHTYNLAGKLTCGELMAFFEISSLYIGNDSGPMHLAASMDIPVIALFGPADEKRWGPLAEKAIILRGEEPCQKCKGNDCQYDFKCIKTLSVETVKIAIKNVTTQPLRDKNTNVSDLSDSPRQKGLLK